MQHIRERRSGRVSPPWGRRLLALVAAAGLATATAVQAEPQQQGQGPAHGDLSGPQREQIKTFMQTREELLKVQQQLQQIQEKAVEARPALQKKQANFAALVEKEMKKQGHSPEQELAAIQALQNKLQSGDTPAGQRQDLMQQLQQKASKYQEAQRAALQNEQVRSARKDLMKDIITAMKQEDPKTDDLIQQMEQKQQKLEELHQNLTTK